MTPRRCPKARAVEIEIPLPGRKETSRTIMCDSSHCIKTILYEDNTIQKGDVLMQLRVNEPYRFFEVWLTQDERDDDALQASLQPLITEYKSRKYRPVLFISGTEDTC